jgi:hypothetical protein
MLQREGWSVNGKRVRRLMADLRSTCLVERADFLSAGPHRQPDGDDPAGRRACGQVEVLDDPLAGDLLKRRGHRGRECPDDAATVEAEGAKQLRLHGSPPIVLRWLF